MYKGVSSSKSGKGVNGGTVNVRMTPARERKAEMGVN
jgi:hypothetical protein